ncbi:MAG: nitrogen fixation negative regulator NifL [Gammaproteobacteria bacterium]
MEKTSLKYLQIHSDIEKVISELAPDLLNLEQGKLIDQLISKRKGLLPAWLFVEAVEQAPVAISITDKKANILYANQAFSKVTGYRLNEIIGKNESVLSNKATPSHVYYDLWHTISRNKIWHGQLVNRHKHGEPYLADLTVAPMQDSQQNITHYLGMHRDISEHYRVEKKLQNQKLLIESVINSSSVAMVVLDQDNNVVLDNLQYKTLISDLGHDEPARLFLDLLSRELGDIKEFLDKNPSGFNNFEVRIDCPTKHSPLWFACSGKKFQEKTTHASSFFKETSQNYLLLSLTNTTHQRRHQEEIYLQSLKVMLTEEEQIRSIRETLLGTIHQVSQPLNQIQAAIHLMQQKGQQGSLLDLLKQLEISCQRTVATLHHCVPEIAPTAITSVNLNQILHEVLMLNNSKFLSNGIVIDWKPCSVLPNILGAENKLRMLFKQLTDNAINALNRSDNNERCITITTQANHQRVHVSIADSGPGIPEHQRTKVFEPFFTTQRWGGVQAGMGLVMAKEIVQQMNGTIEIDPDYVRGCCFKVSFPMINHDAYDRYDG